MGGLQQGTGLMCPMYPVRVCGCKGVSQRCFSYAYGHGLSIIFSGLCFKGLHVLTLVLVGFLKGLGIDMAWVFYTCALCVFICM